MSDFSGFKESYMSPNAQSSNSDTVSGTSNSVSPAPDYSKQNSLNVPSIKIKKELSPSNDVLSKSLDIKKQLSQSFGGGGGPSGGISKPQSRKNSIIPMKSNNASDNEDNDEDETQGNERKRRDNINEKIQELLTLIPAEFFQESAQETKNTQNEAENDNDAAIAAAMKNSGTKDGKPNKGQILTKSVEYLQYLQNLIDENNHREVELQAKLKALTLQEQGSQASLPAPDHTSAEYALGKIGVGPLCDDYYKQVLVSSAGTNKSGQRRASLI